MPPSLREVALIFDLDNTLIDSRIDFLAVRHRLIDLLYKEGAAGQPRDDLIRLALPELVALGGRANPGVADRMWEIIGEAERLGLENATLVAHAPDVVRTLSERGYRLALLTNNARTGVAERLRLFRLEPHFNVIATRDDVPALKPSPDGIRHILERLPGVRRTYLIGDAWIDAQAAHTAGVRFIGFGSKEETVKARRLPIWRWITDLRDLLAIRFEE